MDNLTHTLTGLMLSRAGLDRWTPRAPWLLMLAANAPDIDVISAFGGAANYLAHHRGPTHGLPLAPVIAVVPVLLVGIVRPRGFPWLKAYLASLIGVLSHVLMDWTNIYGVRLLAPFSERWFRLDIINVVDLWIWLVLAWGLFWPILARLVSAEIGAKAPAGRGVAWFAISFLLLFGGARAVLHQRAVETLNARLHAGQTPLRVAALPSTANPLRWTGLVEVSNAWLFHRLDLNREFDPGAGRIYYKAEESAWFETARGTAAFRAFLGFSQFPYWRLTHLAEPEGAVEVRASDLRFGMPGEGRFTAVCILEGGSHVVRSWFQFGPPRSLPRPR